MVPMRFQLPEDFLRHVRMSDGERWCVWLWVLGFVVTLGAALAIIVLKVNSPRLMIGLMAAGVAVAILARAGSKVTYRRERRRVMAGAQLQCCKCRHPVVADGDGERVHCPECGLSESRERLRGMWESRYNVKLPQLRTADEGGVGELKGEQANGREGAGCLPAQG